MAFFFAWAEQKVNFFWNFWKNEPELVYIVCSNLITLYVIDIIKK